MKDRKKRKKLIFRKKCMCDRWELFKCEKTCEAESKFISHVEGMRNVAKGKKKKKLFETLLLLKLL